MPTGPVPDAETPAADAPGAEGAWASAEPTAKASKEANNQLRETFI
jgi:hypothetical protein